VMQPRDPLAKPLTRNASPVMGKLKAGRSRIVTFRFQPGNRRQRATDTVAHSGGDLRQFQTCIAMRMGIGSSADTRSRAPPQGIDGMRQQQASLDVVTGSAISAAIDDLELIPDKARRNSLARATSVSRPAARVLRWCNAAA